MRDNDSSVATATIITRLMVRLPEKLGISFRSINLNAGIDLYKYRTRKSTPLVRSLLSYCKELNIDCSFFLMIAFLVEHGEITEDQALEIFTHPEPFKMGFEEGQSQILLEIKKRFQG